MIWFYSSINYKAAIYLCLITSNSTFTALTCFSFFQSRFIWTVYSDFSFAYYIYQIVFIWALMSNQSLSPIWFISIFKSWSMTHFAHDFKYFRIKLPEFASMKFLLTFNDIRLLFFQINVWIWRPPWLAIKLSLMSSFWRMIGFTDLFIVSSPRM